MLVAHNTLGVLHRHFASALYQQYGTGYDGQQYHDLNQEHNQAAAGRIQQTLAELLYESLRQTGYDTYKDDERDTVTHTLLVYSLAKPHDEH